MRTGRLTVPNPALCTAQACRSGKAPNIFLANGGRKRGWTKAVALASVKVARVGGPLHSAQPCRQVGLVGQEDHRFVALNVLEICVEIGGAA
jgi:hypothetical protein